MRPLLGEVWSQITVHYIISSSSVDNNTALTESGGGLDMRAGKIVIEDSSISNNTAIQSNGGGVAIRVRSKVTLTNSRVTNNRAIDGDGGGIYISSEGPRSTLSGSNSTISGNTARFYGGGISADGQGGQVAIEITNFTIANNHSSSRGGGMWTRSAETIKFRNSTIARNTSPIGGAINAFNTSLSLYNSTVADNTTNSAAAAISNGTVGLKLVNTIISNPAGGADCTVIAGSINTDSATIVQDGSCNTQRAIDPQLGPLADNGGNTLTMALKPNSPARNTGILATCETRDQRGQLRDDGDGACDVGAIEFNQNDDFGEEDSFFVIPLKNKKAVIVPL